MVRDPPSQSSSAPVSASASASAGSPPKQGHRFNLDFQVVDSVGQLEAVQKSDGKVYLPGKHCPIGRK